MNGMTLLGAGASAFIMGYMFAIYEPVAAFTKAEASEFVETKIDIILPEPKVVPPIDLTMLDVVSEKEKHCLIENVYFESRGEPRIGQEAVVWVTINRALSSIYPDDICEVIYQPKQFSWTATLSADDDIMKSEEWKVATEVVEEVLQKFFVAADPTEGSMFFHSTSVSPKWAKTFDKVVRINNHVFYKDNT